MDKRKSSKKIIIHEKKDTTVKAKQLLVKSDLEIMLYKLKNYYDYIQIMKDNKAKKMDDLKFKYDNYDKTVEEIHNLGNLNIEKFNKPFLVSILNSKSTKESKESIEER